LLVNPLQLTSGSSFNSTIRHGELAETPAFKRPENWETFLPKMRHFDWVFRWTS